MKRLIWVAAALPFCVVQGIAQTNLPPPTGHPATGDPARPLAAEPPEIIDKSGVAPGPTALTEVQVRDQLEHDGYRQVAMLSKGDDGIWRGSATKDGAPIRVAVDANGNISGQRTDAGQQTKPASR